MTVALYTYCVVPIFLLAVLALVLRVMQERSPLFTKHEKTANLIFAVLLFIPCFLLPIYLFYFAWTLIGLSDLKTGDLTRLALQAFLIGSGLLVFLSLLSKARLVKQRITALLLMTFLCLLLIMTELATPYIKHAFARESCNAPKYMYLRMLGGEPSRVALFWNKVAGWPAQRPAPCVWSEEQKNKE